MSPQSQIVMADAQFGTPTILRPQPNFEELYDGLPTEFPVYLYPQGRTFDKQALALRPGYDPDLIRGMSVPMGARLVLWIPTMFWVQDDAPLNLSAYTYIFQWRIRNVFDYRVSRIPWHLPRGRGPNDTTGGLPGQPRVVIPGAVNTVVYNQPEPALDLFPVTQSARPEYIKFGTIPMIPPIIEPGFPNLGVVQQGVEDPATAGSQALASGFLVHEMQAVGDELIIAIKRPSDEPTDTWGFLGGAWPGNADFNFSSKLGKGTGSPHPDVGVYVFAGTAP